MSSPFRRPDGSIDVVPHDATWADRFLLARAEILDAAPGVAVEHIGSTSVDGLAAKPTLDILVTFEPGADLGDLVARLEAAGFEHRPAAFGDEPDPHLFLRRVTADHKRSHHLHVLPVGSARALDLLVFRDYLRADEGARTAYQAEKLRLIATGMDRAGYLAAKTAIVEQLLEQARAWSETGANRSV